MSVADHVAADFAMEVVELRERIDSLETDIAIYRELLEAAFDALRVVTIRFERARCERDRLRDELRAFREHALLAAGADDPDVTP